MKKKRKWAGLIKSDGVRERKASPHRRDEQRAALVFQGKQRENVRTATIHRETSPTKENERRKQAKSADFQPGDKRKKDQSQSATKNTSPAKGTTTLNLEEGLPLC